MTQATHRMNAMYLLICANVVLFLLSAGLAVGMLHVWGQVQEAEARGYAGCSRNNVLREGYRFAMRELGSPGRAASPEVAEQPCAQLYPGGAR